MIWRRDRLPTPVFFGFPGSSEGKESTCNVGDLGLIPGLGRSPGEGKGYPLQYNPWGQKESDTTEQLLLSLFMCRCEERSMKNIPTELSDDPATPLPGIYPVKVVQSCSTLQPYGLHSPWNSPGQNIGWVAFPFFRGSSQPRD